MATNDPTIINKFVSAATNCNIGSNDLYVISKQTITNAVRVANSSGLLSSLTINIDGTGVASDSLNAMVFSEDPTSSTVTVGSAIAIATADLPKLMGIINLPNPRKFQATKSNFTQTIITLPISTPTTSIYIVVYRNGNDLWANPTAVTLIATTVWS